MHDISHVFQVEGYFAEKEGVDRQQLKQDQKQDIELGLFRMIFWGGEKPENIRISSHQFRGAEIFYFSVGGKSFWPLREERMLI